ncbi:MAG: UDP-3-O-(3-hydroxymyristoyl)glucosamine N-acyltransferase, partial [Desulfomonilaceae bacterium]
MIIYLAEIAKMLGRHSSDAPGPRISGVKPLEYATRDDVTYVAGAKFMPLLKSSLAAAALVPIGMAAPDRPFIECVNPEADFARLTRLFYGYPKRENSIIAKTACVDASATIGDRVSIDAFAVIGKDSVIGSGVSIGSHTVIGEGVKIGQDSVIFPNVTVYPGSVIGSRVIIHAGAVIGADGFGYAVDTDNYGYPVNIKKFHSGLVEIQDDVEIGALTAIDRALAGATTIGRGVKIDNLVQVAHNVHIGQGTVIASQAGIAGSSSVGSFGMLGGQVGIRDHVSVGDRVILATRVGIY